MNFRRSRAGRRGRPLKFGRPARSVTVTLPEDVLSALRARDRDLGSAIVALHASSSGESSLQPPIVLHQTGDRAVIVVRPVEALRRLPGVELVSLGDPNRALIALTGGLTVAAFELAVQDLLDSGTAEGGDAEVVAHLAAILRETRRTPGRSLSEATIIVLEGPRSRRARGAVSGARRGREAS